MEEVIATLQRRRAFLERILALGKAGPRNPRNNGPAPKCAMNGQPSPGGSAIPMPATREELIDELRQWISTTLDELNQTLEALRSGADPGQIMPRLATALSWSPVIDEVMRLIDDPPAAAPADAHRAKRVLIVDDSHGYRLLATRVLSVAGYDVEAVESGEQAWERIQEQPFDAVITDAEMPGMDGIELVRLIRASREWSRLRVIVLTGRDAPGDEREGIAAGADAFLCKFRPNTVSVLLHHLARMTGRPAA